MSDQEYPRPALTVDVVLLRWHGGALECLLIERGGEPFVGHWALPGGFVDAGETPEAAAVRELYEETHVPGLPLVPLGCFGDPGRDPRGWVVSAAYLAFAPPDTRAEAGDDARRVRWARLDELPPLAFDHAKIIAAARERLNELVQLGTLPMALLPETFRMKQLRWLYSQILAQPLKPSTFKAWVRRRGALERVAPARFRRSLALRPDWLR